MGMLLGLAMRIGLTFVKMQVSNLLYQKYYAVNNNNVISDHQECGCSNNQCTSCTQMRKTDEGPCTAKAENLCRKASILKLVE